MTKGSNTKSADPLGKISEAPHRNHEELFPNHQSTLKVTDPELIEIFDNFAFDDVLAQSKLGTRTRTVINAELEVQNAEPKRKTRARRSILYSTFFILNLNEPLVGLFHQLTPAPLN